MFHYRTRSNNLNAENPIGAGNGLLLSGSNVSTHWRLPEAIVKIVLWLATGDVAQDHEEGVVSEPPRLGRETLGPPLFMYLQIFNQVIEEDPQLDTRDLMLAG